MSGREVITANGFPVYRQQVLSRGTYDTLSIDLNTALIGESNVIEMQIQPHVRGFGRNLTVYPQRFRAEVTCDTTWGGGRGPTVAGTKIPPAEVDSAHAAWSRSARRQWQTYRETVAPGAALDSLRAWARRHPMTVQTTFDNEQGPDFSDLFEEAPVIEGTPPDSARLRAYAMHLRDLMAAKDTSALFREFRPSIEDAYVRLQARGASYTKSEVFTSNRNHLVFDDPAVLDFDQKEVGLRAWSNKRIWELYRIPSDPLLRNLSVYVAEVNDTLRVVR